MASLHDWLSLTSPELGALAAQDPVALLPIAATEQHGPHLPLATDITIGQGILAEAATHLRRAPGNACILKLPPIVLGTSLEHTAFPGTLSLPSETLNQMIRAVGEAVAASGIRRLVLFNSHGGNQAVANDAALQLRAACGLLVVKLHYFRLPLPETLFPRAERDRDLHGGRLETALMLHLAPDSVRLDALKDFAPSGGHPPAAAGDVSLAASGAASFAWMAQDLHPDGVIGNAAGSTAELGRTLLQTYGAQVADLLLQTARFDLAQLR